LADAFLMDVCYNGKELDGKELAGEGHT